MDKTNETQNHVPDWAANHYLDFLIHFMHLVDYRSVSFFGIVALVRNPTALDGLGGRHTSFHQGVIKLAGDEFKEGYPVLQEQTVRALWELLVSFVRTFLTSWLMNQPELTRSKAMRKIKISLADYEEMSQEERYDHLIGELERQLDVPLRQGINRFEALFDAFGLSGPVEERVKKGLFELSHVRNLIVHRRGIADRKFIEACPWKGLKPGEKLALSIDDWDLYLDVVMRYSRVIAKRIETHFGGPMLIPKIYSDKVSETNDPREQNEPG